MTTHHRLTTRERGQHATDNTFKQNYWIDGFFLLAFVSKSKIRRRSARAAAARGDGLGHWRRETPPARLPKCKLCNQFRHAVLHAGTRSETDFVGKNKWNFGSIFPILESSCSCSCRLLQRPQLEFANLQSILLFLLRSLVVDLTF